MRKVDREVAWRKCGRSHMMMLCVRLCIQADGVGRNMELLWKEDTSAHKDAHQATALGYVLPLHP